MVLVHITRRLLQLLLVVFCSTLIDSKNNKIKPHEVKPIEHGQLEIFSHRHLIIGADFNPGSNRLYILIGGADTSQGRFSKLPILMVYKLNSR